MNVAAASPLIALAMATFVHLAYVSGVGNVSPSESVASTTSSPVGRVAIPARIANPSLRRPRRSQTSAPNPLLSHVRVRRLRLGRERRPER